MSEFTCKDCYNYFDSAVGPFCGEKEELQDQICELFKSEDETYRTRFSILASNIDEMACAMIFEWVMPNGDTRYYVHECPFAFHTWKEAKKYAKNRLMEVVE